MAGSISARTFAFWVASWLFPPGIAFLAAAAVFVPTVQAQAQQDTIPTGRSCDRDRRRQRQRDAGLRTDRERCDHQG